MESVATSEIWVFRSDGTAELSSSVARSTPAWVPRLLSSCAATCESAVQLDDGPFRLIARRLLGHDDEESRTLVVVHRRPSHLVNARLTQRQYEVGDLVAAGATVGEAARHLGITPNTVRAHLRTIYRILGVCSRVELARALPLVVSSSHPPIV